MIQYFKICFSAEKASLHSLEKIGEDGTRKAKGKTVFFETYKQETGYTSNTILFSIYGEKGQYQLGYIIVLTPPEDGCSAAGGAHPWGINGKSELKFNGWDEATWKDKIYECVKPHISACVIPAVAEEKKLMKPSGEPVSVKTENNALSPEQLAPMPEFSEPEGMQEMYELAKGIFDQVKKPENEDLWKYVIGYPILWFGDFEAYQQSKVKIITVGINPSKDEFQSEAKDKIQKNPFFRFSGWKEKGMTSEEYFNGMKQYFRNKPYWKWFEPLANAVNLENVWNASYSAGDTQSAVLHIDFCTPCATSPVWSGMEGDVQKKLEKIQNDYFMTLYNFLDPDIVFIGSGQFRKFAKKVNCTPLADMNQGNPPYQKLSSMISNLKNEVGKPHGHRSQLKFYSTFSGKVVITGMNNSIPFVVYSSNSMQEIMREFIRAAKTDPNSIIAKKY